MAALFVKVTLLVLYLRIFHPSRCAQILIWVGIVFVVLFYVACSIGQFKLYLPQTRDPKNIGSHEVIGALLDIFAVQGIIGIVTDLYVLFIPLYLIIGLTLPFIRKIGVCAIFLTGLL